MGRKDWRTPAEFFQSRWALWRFNVDAAADDQNALVGREGQPCGRYYTVETNGLNPDHYVAGDRVWCNPPYVNLADWLKVASDTRAKGVFWELLLPASTDTYWFHAYVWDRSASKPRDGIQVDFLMGRIKFVHPGDRTKKQPPGPTILVRFFPEGFTPAPACCRALVHTERHESPTQAVLL
jgi:phage N-6-adenine-methyltransferase